jgi:hypothetical protein
MINEESGIKTLKEHKSMINEDASLQRERTKITKEEASKFRMNTQRTDMLEAIQVNWNPSLNYIVRFVMAKPRANDCSTSTSVKTAAKEYISSMSHIEGHVLLTLTHVLTFQDRLNNI